MIVTDDEERADRLRRLRAHGGAKQYRHEEIGTNSRLDTIQAAVLLKKLAYLEEWNRARRERAARYSTGLAEIAGLWCPETEPGNEPVFHQYSIRSERRDELRRHLTEQGIGSAIYYPLPLHLQPCFAQLGHREGSLPEAERACREVLSLPVYPELTSDQPGAVVDAIRGFQK